MLASEYIAQFLAERQIPCVFEMSGGMITFLLDAIHRRGETRIVSVHHEQSASFAADAAGRLTGLPGVAMATSGPGATNLLTGIGSCYFDSSPSLFLTGQVNRHELKGDRAIRQLGFQETDIVSMAKPITKEAVLIEDASLLPESLDRAFDVATSGRPGPVLLDIPMDVQRQQIDPPARVKPAPPCGGARLPEIEALFAALARADRPLILAGGGVRSPRAVEKVRALARLLQVPVVNSLMAVGVMPFGDPLQAGLIGSYGNRWANHALSRSDFLLVLGSRLDVRQTGSETHEFRKDKIICHVDCDPGEINNRITGCEAVVSELGDFLDAALSLARDRKSVRRGAWLGEIAALRGDWPDTRELQDIPGINPNALMHALSGAPGAAAAAVYVTDVGQHQMWAAQSLEVRGDQRFLTSGGMGSMGFGLPAAIGAATVTPGRPCVVIAGDGGFQTNIQELETVVRNDLPLKIVIVNNRCHGMVRQFQQSYFQERYQSTLWGYSAPDFEKVAAAYGLDAKTISGPDEIPAAVEWLWRAPLKPQLLQVMVDTFANAYPKLAFGRPMTEMEPLAKPLDMEGT